MGKRRKPSKPKTIVMAGCDDRMELGERYVHDPYQPGMAEKVTVNVRESPLAFMVSRGLVDRPQQMAGEEFRRLYEAAVIGGAQGFDYSRPKVDGGRLGEPLSAQAMIAAAKLAKLAPELGPRGYMLLCLVVGEGRPLAELAKHLKGIVKGTDKQLALYVGDRVREILVDVAHEWGFYGREGSIRSEVTEAPSSFLPEGQDWTPVERDADAA